MEPCFFEIKSYFHRYNAMLSILITLFACLVALSLFVIGFIVFFLSVTTVQGNSMSPTLLPGDRLLVFHHWPKKWFYRRQIVIGDLQKVLENISNDPNVIFTYPISENIDQPPEKFIKRLVGLPGDTISVDIFELHEGLQNLLQPKIDINGSLVWHIPAEYCFVRGDASVSGDSVIWGPIPIKFLTGVVLLKLPSKDYIKQ